MKEKKQVTTAKKQKAEKKPEKKKTGKEPKVIS